MSAERILSIVALALALGVLLSGCGDKDELPPGVAAEVRGRPITETALDHAMIGQVALPRSARNPPPYWPTDVQGCISEKRSGQVRQQSASQAKIACERERTRQRRAALELLILGQWYALEARKRGIDLPSPEKYNLRAASKHSGVPAADLRVVVRAVEASELVRLKDPPPAPRISHAEIARHYRENRQNYVSPPVRVIQALVVPRRNQARSVAEGLEEGESWSRVVTRYAREGARQPFTGTRWSNKLGNSKIADRASLRGPGEVDAVRVPGGWYVYRVVDAPPSRPLPFDRVSHRVWYDLNTRYQRRMRHAFDVRLRAGYRDDTVCASKYDLAECD